MVAARRILVVDDEPMVASSCRRILAAAGDDVQASQSGREGLQRALAGNFDVVMADLRMPDLDGMELVRTLRARRPEVAVIILTGYGSVASAVEAVKLGVVEYIEKPFTPEQLTEAVGRAAVAGPAGGEEEPIIDADQVRQVLKQASEDPDFGRRLLHEGSRVLSGFSLGRRAEAAIVSGDIAWIERRCGELSAEQRDWLQRRLQAEIW